MVLPSVSFGTIYSKNKWKVDNNVIGVKMYDKKIDKNEVKEFLNTCGPNTKVYLGCDSERFRIGGEWYADYMLCVVVHVNGKNGAKLFGQVDRERIWDKNPKKPSMRLMNEVVKVANLFVELQDVLADHEVEVHLDINKSKNHASNVIMNEALGYIRGVCMVEPKIKPAAWAASTAADRLKSLGL